MKIGIDEELIAEFRIAIDIHPEFGGILNAHANNQPTVDYWYPIHEYLRKPAIAKQPVVPPKPTTVIHPKPKPAPIAEPASRQLVACSNCQTVFTPDRKRRTCCSKACSIELGKRNLLANQQRRIHPNDPRPCMQCHRRFVPPKPTGKFCSIPCKNAAARRHAKPTNPPNDHERAQ